MKKVMETSAFIVTSLAIVLTLFFETIPALGITFVTTAYHLDMRLLVGYLLDRVCKNINPNNSWFIEKKWEQKFYTFLRVRKWKRHITTYNKDSFNPKITTIPQILINTCISEVIHLTIVCLSFLPIIISLLVPRLQEDIGIFLITSIIAGMLDSTFVLVQRYNRPRLRKVIERKSLL